MISAMCWVPKGVAKVIPDEAEPPSKEEIEELIKSSNLEGSGDDDNEDNGEEENMVMDTVKNNDDLSHALAAADAVGKRDPNSTTNAIIEGLNELNMEHYDSEDEGIHLFSSGVLSGDLYYPSNAMDPYLQDKDDEDDEEIEDRRILPSDGVIVCAGSEDEVNLLKVYILEEDTEEGSPNLFVHHEVFLPAFPLCTAWLDCNLKNGDKGNFMAVGSMEPEIEIWDLDLVDEVQPFISLGGKKSKKKDKKKVSFKEGSHTDAVLGLSWNKEFRNLLASASADKSVKIWDMVSGKCGHTLKHHSNKVQSVAWNQHQSTVLLSGSFDRSVVMTDMREPSHPGIKWSVPADVEALAWNPHMAHSFVVSLEDGTVHGFDIRAAAKSDPCCKPSFVLHAHDKEVSAVSYNASAANVLATGSTDKTVKLWNIENDQPSTLASLRPKIGAVFSVSFSEDFPSLLAIGGSKGKLKVWNTASNMEIVKRK